MTWVFGVLAAVVAAALLWGLINPGAQWRVLVGWSTSDPSVAEPGGAVHAVRRVICAIGLAGLLAVGTIAVVGEVGAQARPPLAESLLQRMWGAPVPRLLDRVVTTGTTDPVGLAPATVLAVQPIDAGSAPAYLLNMPRWSLLGNEAPAGVLGSAPPKDSTGYGAASLMVSVSGPLMCIPRAVVVHESETEVVVGVWFGLPDAPDGAARDSVAGCPENPSASERVLVPVPLFSDVGDRRVVSMDGVQLREVETP